MKFFVTVHEKKSIVILTRADALGCMRPWKELLDRGGAPGRGPTDRRFELSYPGSEELPLDESFLADPLRPGDVDGEYAIGV